MTSSGEARPNPVQAEMLGLDEEKFLAQCPVGRKFGSELTVRVIDEDTFTPVSALLQQWFSLRAR